MAADSKRVIVPVADIKSAPQPQAGLLSQLVLGDDVLVLESVADFCRIQSVKDSYPPLLGVMWRNCHIISVCHEPLSILALI